MRKFYVCIIALFMLSSIDALAQKDQKVVIDIRGIGSYHDKKELESMTKGQLMPLYLERVKILFSVIQYFGVTNKSGVTFTDLGIPASKDNVKALETEVQNREAFLNSNAQFLTGILPYSDTSNIIKAILFYEEVLKLVHTIQVE
ncbi:hypothetical protein SY27_11510 [Flavobacterium sp. 316]|uniref:Uncharacterized protein n=1 Tax=Flavobacterium sediminilitoris TaxID=2024526 RepID=A0ABY4HQD3_9FLAO|nr:MULTISPECIES: hypothetical protein [Flavobacterium]KIX20534.1 hypothetical protein SY27_11510 [Flavobacterium sp. 316]UOX34900.1 hypothetical protein LXD69_05155 [Flavobacterium sediminilitoris]